MNKFLIIPALMMLLLTTACWDSMDIEERAIVAGMGIDKSQEPGKIDLTVQIIKPSAVKGGGSGQGGSAEQGFASAVWVVTASGDSLFDGVRNLAERAGRKLFFSKCKVYVISEDFAKEGIDTVTDWLGRDPETRYESKLVIANGRAEDILRTSPNLGKIEAYTLNSMVESTRFHSKGIDVDLAEFFRTLLNETSAPVATAVSLIQEKNVDQSQAASKNSNKTEVSGTAVFRQYKLAGFLTPIETRGLLWVTNQVKSGIIVINAPDHKDKKIASLEILSSNCQIEPEIKNENISITVKVKEKGNIGEIEASAADFTKPDIYKSLEKRQAQAIKNEIRAALIRAQEMNTDVFGFDQAVRRKYPDQWQEIKKNWDDIFPFLEVKIEVKAEIPRTGMTSESFKPGLK